MFCANHRLNNSIRLASISRSEELDVSFFHYLQTRKREREIVQYVFTCFNSSQWDETLYNRVRMPIIRHFTKKKKRKKKRMAFSVVKSSTSMFMLNKLLIYCLMNQSVTSMYIHQSREREREREREKKNDLFLVSLIKSTK